MNVCDILNWPPGALMRFDNTRISVLRGHVGLGMVVANDGVNTIHVVWDAGCKEPFKGYEVSSLNPLVVSRVG